ncbi:MAG: NAD-dependent epimerase/dehydratase family protein [bacterium]
MKILVTGGAGFIGSHIVDAFLGLGHEVTIIDSLITGQRENVNPRARFYEIDIRSKELAAIFAREKFEVVCHHAAQMDVRKSVDDPRYDADVNIMGTLNLLERARETGVRKFIFASSGGAMYGEQEKFPADEEHRTWPASPYGITKLTCEKYIAFFGQNYNMSYVLLRYANVYGPRQSPHGEAGVVAIFTSRLLAGQQPVINGDGKQTRDYVYVHDVVKANVAALNFTHSDYFNIGTGIETDVNELFQRLNAAAGQRAQEQHAPAKAGEQLHSVLDAGKAKRLLHWQPATPFHQGLAETVSWFQERRK